MGMLTLLQYNSYLILFSYTTSMMCVNFSHTPGKLICLFTNHSSTTYQGDSSTCGTKCIVLREVFPNFWQNVFCVCSLLCMASTLLLSHADTRSWSSSTLKLEPHFPYVKEAFSTWGRESEIDIGVFWEVPKSCESISISPFMIPVQYVTSLHDYMSLRDFIKLEKKKNVNFPAHRIFPN